MCGEKAIKIVYEGDTQTVIKGENCSLVITTQNADERSVLIEKESNSIPSPYRDLNAFTEHDYDIFFGRERLVQKLHEKLIQLHQRDHSGQLRILPVLAPSGMGKTSLIRAGLLPELAAQPLPNCSRLNVLLLTPTPHPIRNLAQLLARTCRNSRKEPDIHALQQALFTDNCALRNTIEQSSLSSTPPPYLLVIDQLEELFSVCNSTEERHCFINNILWAATSVHIPISIILVLRSDFLHHIQQHHVLYQAVSKNAFIVPILSSQELRQIIVEPAKRIGYLYDDKVVDTLLTQTRQCQTALPLLQFTLSRLWRGMNQGIDPLSALQALGGVSHALNTTAEQLYILLSQSKKEIARDIFLKMVHSLDTGQYVRQRFVLHNEEDAELLAVLQYFSQADARFVQLTHKKDKVIATISHDIVLHSWQSMQQWLVQQREIKLFFSYLSKASVDWDKAERKRYFLWSIAEVRLIKRFSQQFQRQSTAIEKSFIEASERYFYIKRFMVTTGISLLVLSCFYLSLSMWDSQTRIHTAYAAQRSAQQQQQQAENVAATKVAELEQTRVTLKLIEEELYKARLAEQQAREKASNLQQTLDQAKLTGKKGLKSKKLRQITYPPSHVRKKKRPSKKQATPRKNSNVIKNTNELF